MEIILDFMLFLYKNYCVVLNEFEKLFIERFKYLEIYFFFCREKDMLYVIRIFDVEVSKVYDCI